MVETGSRLLLAPHGDAARRELAALIGRLQHGDPLHPVTVVMPSALSAVTMRRALGRDGLVATEFVTLPALTPQLAAGALASTANERVTKIEQRMFVRAALSDGHTRMAALARHPATLAALVETFAELRTLTAAELGALAAINRRSADVVDLYRSYRRQVGDRTDDHDVFAAAVTAVASGAPVLREIGDVILHVPRRLRRDELELLRALAGRDVL